MGELDSEESWVQKSWCFWTVVLEKTLESPFDCKEIQPVQPKGDQSWVFFGGTDVEAETPVLWPPDAKSWLIRKDPGAGKDWRWKEKRMTEDELVGWHHRLNGHGFGWTPGVGDGQGGLVCCSPWGHRVGHDWAAALNWATGLSWPETKTWKNLFKVGDGHWGNSWGLEDQSSCSPNIMGKKEWLKVHLGTWGSGSLEKLHCFIHGVRWQRFSATDPGGGKLWVIWASRSWCDLGRETTERDAWVRDSPRNGYRGKWGGFCCSFPGFVSCDSVGTLVTPTDPDGTPWWGQTARRQKSRLWGHVILQTHTFYFTIVDSPFFLPGESFFFFF